jgi:hypothetical protein
LYRVYDGSIAVSSDLVGSASVNQELVPNDFDDQGGVWEELGEFDITGSSLLVQLTDAANEFVIADAIWIARIGDVDPGGNGQAGFTFTPAGGLVTTESGVSDFFTVVLDSEPTAQVRLALRSSNTAEGFVQPSEVVFNVQDWNVPKNVVVTGVEDAIADGSRTYKVLTGPASSSDSDYNGLNPIDLEVTNLDNETAGVVVAAAPNLQTNESGGTASFRVQLTLPPQAPVRIDLSSSDLSEGVVSPSSLVFTSANWGNPQRVTVTGVDDALADGNVSYGIDIAAAVSADPNFQGLRPVPRVSLVNLDNDTAGILVNPASGLVLREGGSGTSLSVSLAARPSAPVVLGISSSPSSVVTQSPSWLLFLPSTWNQPQQLSVSAIDDNVVDGDQPFTIMISVISPEDPAYVGLSTQVTGLAEDND